MKTQTVKQAVRIQAEIDAIERLRKKAGLDSGVVRMAQEINELWVVQLVAEIEKLVEAGAQKRISELKGKLDAL